MIDRCKVLKSSTMMGDMDDKAALTRVGGMGSREQVEGLVLEALTGKKVACGGRGMQQEQEC